MRANFELATVCLWPLGIAYAGVYWLTGWPLVVGSLLFAPVIAVYAARPRPLEVWTATLAGLGLCAMALLGSVELGAVLFGVALAILSLVVFEEIFAKLGAFPPFQAAALLAWNGVLLLLSAPAMSGGATMHPTGLLVFTRMGAALLFVGLGAFIVRLAFSTPPEERPSVPS